MVVKRIFWIYKLSILLYITGHVSNYSYMNLDKKSTENDVEELFTNPEPWEAWESKLVIWSILAAFVSLIILGILINWLIL